MIHVDTIPIDIEDMRDWANGYKAMHGLSWTKFGDLIGIPGGTLQPFCKGNYAGDNDRIARALFKFRQAEQSRSERLAGIPVDPGYFPTPTSDRIESLLALAAAGNITAGGIGSGMGKSVTAENFLGMFNPAWMVTMDPVSGRTNAMIRLVEKEIGVQTNRNWPSLINVEIIAFLRKRRALIIVDEANNLEYQALEQLRAWHDATKVGICLLGNKELITQIESGKHNDAFARLNSRITKRLVQTKPEEGDVVAFCDAWQLFDPAVRKLLMDVALRPGSGALRECRQIIQNASMAASEDGGVLELAHVRWAVEDRAVRIVR